MVKTRSGTTKNLPRTSEGEVLQTDFDFTADSDGEESWPRVIIEAHSDNPVCKFCKEVSGKNLEHWDSILCKFVSKYPS